MYYIVTYPLLFAHQYQMGSAIKVLNLYNIHSDSYDLQSMSATYIKPNKNCEIIGPWIPAYIYVSILHEIIGDHWVIKWWLALNLLHICFTTALL